MGMCKFSVAGPWRKLASYEVAGWNEQIDFVPDLSRRGRAKAEGTAELNGRFPASFPDAGFCGRGFLRSWLISDAPSEQGAEDFCAKHAN
jgi:hypothetical protein